VNPAEPVDATFYAQVVPEWSPYPRAVDGKPRLRGARVVRITQARPQQPRPGVVVVKLTLRLPESAFQPLQPAAVVVVPESATEPVQVTVEHPAAGAEDHERSV